MTTKKKQRGAPKKDNPAVERIHVRCTPEQRARWKLAADKAGVTLSTWLKRLADRSS